jgi:transposase InsO family protein
MYPVDVIAGDKDVITLSHGFYLSQIIIERWRIHYNTVRPHSSLGGQPPAPETIQFAC